MDQNSKTPSLKPETSGFAKSASIKLLIIGLIALALLIFLNLTQ